MCIRITCLSAKLREITEYPDQGILFIVVPSTETSSKLPLEEVMIESFDPDVASITFFSY